MADTARRRRAVAALDPGRLNIFVPAVMSVGLVFWLAAELRELVSSRLGRARDRRAAAAGGEVATETLRSETAPATSLRPRPVYLVLATTLIGAGGYVAIGSIANYARPDGYVSDIAWLLVTALGAAAVAAGYGVVSLALFVTHPSPPPVLRRVLARSPLGVAPGSGNDHARPSWRVTAGFTFSLAAAAVVALIVAWSPHVVDELDRDLSGWLADQGWIDGLAPLTVLGSTPVALGLVAVAGLAAFRCRALALAYGSAVVVGFLASLSIRPLVGRARPGIDGSLDSFPSGHIVQSVIIAGLLPVAIAVVTRRRWVIWPLRVGLGAAAAIGALQRVADAEHWPTDVAGGALIGLALVLAAQWLLDTGESHDGCRGCPWHPETERPHAERGAITLSVSGLGLVRTAGQLSAAAAVVTLTVLTFTRGIPENPIGFGFASSIQRPVQLALAGLASVGTLVSRRYAAVGAVLLALAATGLGILASVEYQPVWGLVLTLALLVPAVLVWLGWQHHRTPLEIVVLAVVTLSLTGGAWVGANRVYDFYFGPTHPDSAAVALDADRVDWVWTGNVGPRTVTVTARLADDRTRAIVVARGGGHEVRSTEVVPGRHRLVSLTLDDLRPDTAYHYALVVDGTEDRSRGRGSFQTPAEGAQSFRIAAGSCARTGSNGAVFDAIRAADPLLYLQLGDLHYRNIEEGSVDPFLSAFDTVLTRPGQSALYRDVPVAYVWDDHDYGPNDADASSPTRDAAREAYGLAVPHAPLEVGDTIAQAFTIGRVRIVMTDARSERTGSTMLGAEQRTWLVEELTAAARTHAVVIWANATPWIGEEAAGSDTWAGRAAERRDIAQALADAGVDNLVMVSGDAHMVAIDDGTNSAYDRAGVSGFPVLQAAALDRPGNVKGGPYTEGTFPGGGQFGLIDIDDDGGPSVTVTLSGHDWRGETLVSYQRTFAIGS